MMRAPPRLPSPPSSATAPHLLLYASSAACRLPPSAAAVARSVSVSTTVVDAPAAAAEPGSSDSASATPRRRLILLRHGDSAVGERFTRDHDRPLSKSGRADAISVSDKFHKMGWIPELILCSDATRTKETLQIMQEHVQGLSQSLVHFIPSFYSIAAMDGQTAEHLQKAICEYSTDEILTVMCMGHNKGWEEAASMFSGDSVVLKTCNAALLEAAGKSWIEAFSQAGLGGWKLHGIVKP
ncbi:hypothetical protein D1007_09246 [Hordeum vulgare]|uniref:Predicted protein n=1 Tax=Hordeum vulgare subsp. vulgare TaxID=112509 RepID=F2DCA4_HORVV|nr:uncharacterized protein At3g52155, chloroplastic [Hordeum vulgare subsp. vulgare]KAE8813545.1 hypothetical protein D1007_09246 [Hordeum vulgare]KAI4991115.1 hypothetical protein ZWY2020_039486 [Hordeum vulgare]BAJ92725.1 predicted protein [Hordeum vulgare subsp. vulgare]